MRSHFARAGANAAAAGVVALAIMVGLVRARTRIDRSEAERARADTIVPLPARCSARAWVESSPVRIRGAIRWDGRLEASCDGAAGPWTGRATIYGGPEELARGDEVDIVATLAPPQRLWNPAGGDPRPAEALRGVARTGGALDVHVARRASGLLAWIDRGRGRVRRRIDASFDATVAPMARALVLGESDLAPDDDSAFRASGLSHLLAVSGMHLVLVLALAVHTLEGALRRIERIAAGLDVGRYAAAIGIPIAWLYAEFAGAGGSTLRAAWMATAALAARALGRRGDAARAFGLSMGAMALAEPLVAFDLSFALSAGATAGLLVFAGPLGDRLEARAANIAWAPGVAKNLARAIGTTVAASVPCAPILARFAPTVPVGGVLANLVAVPLGESAALPLCLLHAVLAGWPSAERGCAAVATGALYLVRGIARGFAAPWLTAQVPQPTSWQLVALVATLAAVALRPPRRALLTSLGLLVVAAFEVNARRAGAPLGQLRATFLDVGQGDSAILDLPDGEAIVVDGGGLVGSPIDVGTRVLAPELRARRRAGLAAVVLTHPHPDHFGGLATGLDRRRRGEPVGHGTGGARTGRWGLRGAPRVDARPRGADSPAGRALRVAGPGRCPDRSPRAVPRSVVRSKSRTTTRSSFASPMARGRCSSWGTRSAKRKTSCSPGTRRACERTSSRWATTGARRLRRPRFLPPSRPATPSSRSGGAIASVTPTR